jgi:hypothetical protein
MFEKPFFEKLPKKSAANTSSAAPAHSEASSRNCRPENLCKKSGIDGAFSVPPPPRFP